jgi:hypothetical protein
MCYNLLLSTCVTSILTKRSQNEPSMSRTANLTED